MALSARQRLFLREFDGVPSDFAAVGDFNGDGKPDLAVVNGPYNSNDSVTVLTNTSP